MEDTWQVGSLDFRIIVNRKVPNIIQIISNIAIIQTRPTNSLRFFWSSIIFYILTKQL